MKHLILFLTLLSSTLCLRAVATESSDPVINGDMVQIPGGPFQMGDPSSPLIGFAAERPIHSVQVATFYMAKYETTKELWDEVRAWGMANGRGYTDLATGNRSYTSKGVNHPVHSINWYDIVKWCNARSEKENLQPCYTVGGLTFKTGQNSAVVCNFSANGYRLPTEAEWEKAARGGANGKNFPWGTDTISHQQSNYTAVPGYVSYDVNGTLDSFHPTYKVGGEPYTAPVDSFTPNGYGLFNMSGNLWEWCWDWYGSYTAETQTDPRGATSGSGRVERGGAWGSDAKQCRASNRFPVEPDFSFGYDAGFRLARSSSDFMYVVSDGLITITGYTGPSGAVTIPITIAELPVTRIGPSAFSNNAQLTSVTIPNGVTSIGYSAFAQCSSLTTVMLPASLTSIEAEAFLSCRGLVQIVIPASITSILEGTFQGCSSLTSLQIPSGVTSIGPNAFSGCASLPSITLPDTVTQIERGAFAYCSSLTGINIPEGINFISSWAFTDCGSLLNLTLPSSVTNIGEYAFRGCSSLASLNIPTSVTTIGDWAFGACSSVDIITIPALVTSIGEGAFAYCSALTSTTFLGNAPTMGDRAFDEAAEEFKIYYYQNQTGYSSPTWHTYQAVMLIMLTFEPEIAVEQPAGTDIADADTKNFGSSIIGTPVSLIFTIKNTGNDNLTGLTITKSGNHAEDFTVTSNPEAPVSGPTGTTTFTVTFTPTAAGARSAALQIASNDATENLFDINLGGTGVAADPYDITFVGTPYELRVGNQVAFDLNRLLTTGETLKVGGKIPTGLKFNALTGQLTGFLAGKAGIYQVSVQVLQGKTVIRTITLPITVLDFPTTLIGNFDFLMEDSNSVPVGVCKIIITKANGWSATLESAGSSKKRSAKGTFILAEGSPVAPIIAAFPADTSAPAVTVNISLNGSTPVITGIYNGGTLRGFRIAKVGETPPTTVPYSLVLDAGNQDGITVPAGLGWMKGKVSNKGIGTFKGLLGDGTTASITLGLSAYGQAILWSQPYKKKTSYIGGIVTLGNLGQTTPGEPPLTKEVWWTKTADTTTLSYPNGFPGMSVTVGTSRWTAPASATTLGSSLGWRDNSKTSIMIHGAGLSNQEPQSTTAKLPTEFTLDSKFALVTSLPVGATPVAWKGKASKTDGAISGALTIPAGFSSDVPSGSAAVNGVLVQDEPWGITTGCGQIKVPASGPKGSFKTASIILGQ